MNSSFSTKRPCKFKGSCKSYREGKVCNFSHDQCKFGNTCKNIETCQYFHEEAGNKQSAPPQRKEFSQPKNEVLCKFGAKCNKLAEGKCFFKHDMSQQAQGNQPRGDDRPNRSEVPCKFGDRCTLLPLGKCPFKHQNRQRIEQAPPASSLNIVSSVQQQRADVTQGHLYLFDQLCVNFLMSRSDSGDCNKIHEYCINKNIKKIFEIGQGNTIRKVLVLQPYAIDQQPLYVLQSERKIIFGQLVNLAKESGYESVNTSSLIMKRWYNRDISFSNEQIKYMDLQTTLTAQFPRLDFLLAATRAEIHILILNRNKLHSFPCIKNISSSIFIGRHLLILFQDRSCLLLRFQHEQLQFLEDASLKFDRPLVSVKKCSRKLFGSEIVIGMSEDGQICLINQQLQSHYIDIGSKVKDCLVNDFANLPVALLLTDNNEVICLNLLTFQKTTVLTGTIRQNLKFTSMAFTQNHLCLAINQWGILIYSFGSFDVPVGVLSLGNRQWSMQCDNRGNLVLMSEQNGSSWLSIFKIRKN